MNEWNKKLLFILILLTIFSYEAVLANDIKECVENKKAAAGSPTPWSVSGGVTCPAADVVGFPPRERKHNRDGFVSYRAKQGYKIVNTSVNDINIVVKSSTNGWNGGPIINIDETFVKVPVHCRGRGLGQGRTWHNITVSGKELKALTDDEIIQFTIECYKDLQ